MVVQSRIRGLAVDSDRIKELHSQGLVTSVIATRTGTTKSIVLYWLKKFELKPNRD